MIAVSTGCPAGVGPEVSILAASKLRGVTAVLVGDERTLYAAAEVVGVSTKRLVRFDGALAAKPGTIFVLQAGPVLAPSDRRPGRPTKAAGRAQLSYIDAAYGLAKSAGAPLVSGPVSKAAIARSGSKGAARFLGHTEWLRESDHAPYAIMCFAAPGLVTSLVTTHLPLSKVPRAVTESGVRDAVVELVRLLRALGTSRPAVAVASLNPHAGESELLGREEKTAIVPGMARARAILGRGARIVGPVGAETAYRLMRGGRYDGVVAMYHDQATIPMKLVAFGTAVNVTMGLSVVRTSVDHGTAYDIAWTGTADPAAMAAAIRLASRLGGRGAAPAAKRSR